MAGDWGGAGKGQRISNPKLCQQKWFLAKFHCTPLYDFANAGGSEGRLGGGGGQGSFYGGVQRGGSGWAPPPGLPNF